MRRIVCTSVSVIALAMAVSAPAKAADSTNTSAEALNNFAADAAGNDALAADAATDGGAIVVTGSRIARPELESAMPVRIVNMDETRDLGVVTAYDALVREPSIGTGTGRGNAQNSMDGGTASINLRNLGTNRTLTLVDGRRRVSGSARTSAVDLNLIPSAMIDRVEVITGGAAAIYGADAVTGAVNVVMRREIEKTELNVTGGVSEYGDAESLSATLATGAKFANDRGSITFGASYVNSAGLKVDDREFGDTRLIYIANPKNTGPNDGIPDRVIAYDFGEFYYQFYPTYVVNNTNYGYENGQIRELFVQTPVNAKGEFYGGDGGGVSDIRNLNEGNTLRAPMEQMAFNTRLYYELGSGIESTTSLDLARSKYDGTLTYYREDSRGNFMHGAGSPWAYLDNPYLPDEIRAVMEEEGLDRLRISRAYKEMGLFRDVQIRNSFTVSQAFNGALSDRFNWEVFAQYGRTKNKQTFPDFLRYSSWMGSRDVIADPDTGLPVCRDEAARDRGCVPVNIFDNGPLSQEQREWLFTDRVETRKNSQQVYGGSIVGDAFALPYGDVKIALGAEHRRETLSTKDDPLSTSGELSHGYLLSKHPDIEASFNVTELFGEIVVPVLRYLPFAHRLEVEGAYRYSDYSTVGGTHAWKIGATWSPIADLTLRGVRSRSVRTPNFGELFEPNNVTQNNLSDPCENPFIYASANREKNCLALGVSEPVVNSLEVSNITAGGNPDLNPETSNSLTLGLVFQPSFLRGFDMTVDYWDISIDDVITQFGANNILNYCVDLPTIDNVFCNQVVRDQSDPAREVLSVSTQTINVSSLTARGIDFGANYRTALGAGSLNFALKGTYLLEKQLEAIPGIANSIVQEMGRTADTRFRGSATVSYKQGPFSALVNARLIGSSIFDPNALSDEYNDQDEVPAIVYTDIGVGYQVNENLRLSAGVNNLLDVKPPYLQGTYLGAGGIYDVVGRNAFLSIGISF